MGHWLAVTNFENWKIVNQKNIWGVAKHHKNVIKKVQPDDNILFYVSGRIVEKERIPGMITAAYDVVSPCYEDDTSIFISPNSMGDEVFPLRIKIKPYKIFSPPIEFKPLVNSLTFVKNKHWWVGSIRGRAMRPIPNQDFELIMSKA